MAETLKVNRKTATVIRHHAQTSIKRSKGFNSAVNNDINSSQLQNKSSSSLASIEFKLTSRVNDGPIIGQEIAAPEIAVPSHTSGQQCTSPRAAMASPRDNPDDEPRLLPIWSAANEPLQYPSVFLNGEAGWSEKITKTNLRYLNPKTMNRTNTAPVPFLAYCRQCLLAERS